MIKKCSLVLCVLLLNACASSFTVFSDFDTEHSFSAYKTFSWAHNPPLVVAGNLPISEEIESRATQAIKEQLTAKGFEFLENADQAQFLVAYTLGARDNVEIYQASSSVYDNKDNWLWGQEYHSYYFDMVLAEEFRAGYTKGVIAVDIFDRQRQAPVWHGKASKSLDKAEIASNGGGVEQAVEAVLERFPPNY